MPSHRKSLATAVLSLITALAVPLANADAAGGTASGSATFSGSLHGHDSLKGKNRCQIAGGGGVTNVNLYAGTYRGTTDGFAGYNYPYIVVTRIRGSAPGHDVNLAKTKDYLISVQAPQGASHLGDWGSGNLGDEHKAIHMGSGRLTFASDGRSGSINTELTPLAHTMTHGKVHLKASWTCSKSSVEG
jgi:hypothetical protein